MNKQRTLAKLTGYSLLLMAIIAGFSFGFAFPKLYNINQADLAQNNVTENMELYKLMLLGILGVILLDVLVSWSLFQYFKNENKKLALLSFVARIIYTILFGFAAFYLTINIGVTKNNNAFVLENYHRFEKIWAIGLIIFGVHLLFVAELMRRHKVIPKFLWYLTFIAGGSYVLVHLLKTIAPDLNALTNNLNAILALPMALGELGLAVWLITNGGKSEDRKNVLE